MTTLLSPLYYYRGKFIGLENILLEIFTKCLKNRLRVKTKGKAKDPYSLHHVFSYFNQNCSHLFKISKFCVKRINTSVHFFNKRLSLITEPNL